MLNQKFLWLHVILPVIIVLFSLLIGILIDKFIRARLVKIAKRTKWKGDEVIISSFHHMFIIWFLIGGIYIALKFVPISQALFNLFSKVLLIGIIFSITHFFAKIAVGFINLYSERVKDILPTPSIFLNLAKILIFIVGSLIIMHTLGISITPILTFLGIGGFAVALAFQDTLNNLFSGFYIVLSRQLKPGDYIKLESGEEGYIVDISWRNTTIRQLPNNMIIIPNSKLGSALVINYYSPEKELAVLVGVGVSYDSDLEKVERVTIEVGQEVMKEVPGGVPDFTPFIRYHTFADFSINFTVILRAKEFVDQYLIKHEFVKRLHRRYKEEGITIPFPIRTVYMHEDKIKTMNRDKEEF